MTKKHVEYITAVIGSISWKTGISCSKIYRAINNAGLINGYLVKCFDVLHTFSLEYVAEDILNILKRRKISL